MSLRTAHLLAVNVRSPAKVAAPTTPKAVRFAIGSSSSVFDITRETDKHQRAFSGTTGEGIDEGIDGALDACLGGGSAGGRGGGERRSSAGGGVSGETHGFQ